MFRTLSAKAFPRCGWTLSRRALCAATGFGSAAAFAGVTVFCAGAPAAAAPTPTPAKNTPVAAATTPTDATLPPFDYVAVKKALEAMFDADLSIAPTILRLAWHQAGTWDAKAKNGCPNSGSMRFKPESDHGANKGLAGAREKLEAIKKKHPGITYGDLYSLAGVVAVEAMGGPVIPWRWGRTEAHSGADCSPDGRLPDAAQGAAHIRAVFGRMGFNDREAVALIGAHTVGECHANASGYVGPWTHDKLGFDTDFFAELLNNDWIVDRRYETLQFKDSKTGNLMMLPTDLALILDPKLRKHVEAFAADQDAFHKAFASAFTRLIELGNHNLHRVPAAKK